MARPRSVRLRSDVGERLDSYVREVGGSSSSVIERLLDEALRRERHPDVTFRDGPAGRRAGLVRGPDVWEIAGSLKANRAESPDASGEAMLELLEQSTGLPRRDLRAALRYYAEFTDEVDAWIASNDALAARLEALWRREQELLAGSA
ncbi:MAG: CopG family transcriptional regulator [Actinomycetota bacterium]|nr:CopG family transcriptional regulator [Geodermatophilaceae bacterium]MDQ3476627.1 CopG family transcriptional regulator [Actinomycetota bacterium]